MLELFSQTLAVTVPVFAMVLLGIVLKRIDWIDSAFIGTASLLVFKGCMPTLIFISLLKADTHAAIGFGLLSYFTLAMLASVGLALAWGIWRIPREDRGVYVQGAFRGNCGIVGLALAVSSYGDFGLALGGIFAAIVIVIYNVTSTVILAHYSADIRSSWRDNARGIATNPLILGVVLALPFAFFDIGLPDWLMRSAQLFADLTLPLALICIGGTLSLAAIAQASRIAVSASAMKLLGLPLVFTALAYALGFRGSELGVMFLYFGSPTAAASFVMARAYGANDKLAAAIIVLTTIAAAVTINLGMFVLSSIGAI